MTDKVKLFAGYSNGFSAPNFNEMFWPGYYFAGSLIPVSNPKLKPEHATYAQAGAQYSDDYLTGRVTYFETHYRDKIAFSSTFPSIPVNVNRAKARGVEWSGSYHRDGWNFDSNLTYQDVKDSATGERFLRQPRILAGLGVGKTWGKWHGQVDWHMQGNVIDQVYDTNFNPTKVKVGGYSVVNAALTYAPMSNVKLGLSVGNLFNRHYQTVYGYNSMPRNVLLSLQYQPKW